MRRPCVFQQHELEHHADWPRACVHELQPGAAKTLVGMWGNVNAQQAYKMLASPDVVVTNAKDKQMQLPKMLKLDEDVRSAMVRASTHVVDIDDN